MEPQHARSFRTLLGLALALLPAAGGWAAENLVPPFGSPTAQTGSSIPAPWHTSDGNDNGNVSVRLGSPKKDGADWAEFRDDSLTHTANSRFGGLSPLSKGSFSFEISTPKEANSAIFVSLGVKAVADTNSRIITWQFLPGGRIQVSTHDEEQEVAYRYTPGNAEKFRCEFDLKSESGATVTFFSETGSDPIAHIQRSTPLPPIDGVRITSTQKGNNLRWFIRSLSLSKN